MIGLWVFCVASQASPISVVSKIEGANATVDVTLTEDFDTVRKNIGEKLDTLLSGTPYIRQATKLSSSVTEGPVTPGSNDRKLEAKDTLFVKGANPKILPESLFKMDRTETNCASVNCTPRTEVKISGPEASYKTFVDFQNVKLPSGSFELSFTAVPVTGSTVGANSKVTVTLKIVDRAYQAYVQSLRLAKTPTELDLQKGFMLWAHAIVGRLGGA